MLTEKQLKKKSIKQLLKLKTSLVILCRPIPGKEALVKRAQIFLKTVHKVIDSKLIEESKKRKERK